jgi:hypothetical protein
MKTLFGNRLFLVVLILAVLIIVAGVASYVFISRAAAAPPSATCGTVNTHAGGLQAFNAGATSAENCFWNVYQHCGAMTLVVHYMGTDTGDDRTFWPTSQNGRCTILGQTTFYSANGGGSSHTSSFTCLSVTRQADGSLLFSHCSDENGTEDLAAPPYKP